jgi:anti-sigma factor RsiW
VAHQHDENCRKMFALLSEFLDLELPPDTCREMEAHMGGCTPCAEFTRSLRKTIELCHAYQPQEVPGPLAEDARRKLLAAYQKMVGGRERRLP